MRRINYQVINDAAMAPAMEIPTTLPINCSKTVSCACPKDIPKNAEKHDLRLRIDDTATVGRGGSRGVAKI